MGDLAAANEAGAAEVPVGDAREPMNYAKRHRARLRARYRVSGEAALQDYELLELLLTFAIPRRDTKLLAKKPLERFGSLGRVFEADSATLQEKTFLRSTGDAGAYFQATLKGLPEEEVHVAFAIARNVGAATECLQRGTVDQTVVSVRKAVQRALAHKTSGLTLAHAHPGGDPAPRTTPGNCSRREMPPRAAWAPSPRPTRSSPTALPPGSRSPVRWAVEAAGSPRPAIGPGQGRDPCRHRSCSRSTTMSSDPGASSQPVG